MTIAGVLLVLMGGVWILQGINVLPGSFMTGQTKWAVYGAITAVIGIAISSNLRMDSPSAGANQAFSGPLGEPIQALFRHLVGGVT